MHRSTAKIYDSGQWPLRRMGGPSFRQSFRSSCRCIGINDPCRCCYCCCLPRRRRRHDDGDDDELTCTAASLAGCTEYHYSSTRHQPPDNTVTVQADDATTQFIAHYLNSHCTTTATAAALNCLPTRAPSSGYLPSPPVPTDQAGDHQANVRSDRPPNDANSASIALFCIFCPHCNTSPGSNLSSELPPPKPHHHASLCLISSRPTIAATLTCHHRLNNVPTAELPTLQGPTELKSAAMNINELWHRSLFFLCLFLLLVGTRFCLNISHCSTVPVPPIRRPTFPPDTPLRRANSICLPKSNNTISSGCFTFQGQSWLAPCQLANYTHTAMLQVPPVGYIKPLPNQINENDTAANVLNNSSNTDLLASAESFNPLPCWLAIFLSGNLSSPPAPGNRLPAAVSLLVHFGPLLIHQLFELTLLMTFIFHHYRFRDHFLKVNFALLFPKLPYLFSLHQCDQANSGSISSTAVNLPANAANKGQIRACQKEAFPLIFKPTRTALAAAVTSLISVFIFQCASLIAKVARQQQMMPPYQAPHRHRLTPSFKCSNSNTLFSMIYYRTRMTTVIQFNKLLLLLPFLWPFHRPLNASIATVAQQSAFTLWPYLCSLISQIQSIFKMLLTLLSSSSPAKLLRLLKKLFYHYDATAAAHLQSSAKMAASNHFTLAKIFLFFLLVQSELAPSTEAVNSLVSVTSSVASQPEHKTYPDLNVLIGHTARLPCDLSTPGQVDLPVMEQDLDQRTLSASQNVYRSAKTTANPDPYAASDPVQLVLWYHGADISGSPFYSVDARHNSVDQRNKVMQMMGHLGQKGGTSSGEATSTAEPKLKHFVVPPYSDRASFELKHHQATNKPALLTIQSVQENDAGIYWCRVDYRWTRTTISKVRLNVLVPPKRLLMYRLAPADSSAELFPLVNSGRTGESSAWRVSQLLSSIISVNSSALSYVPFGLSVPPPPPLDIISASASHPIDSSNSRVSSSSTSSRRRLLQVHELTSSVLYLDEGIDTLIGCEAIGGNPLATVTWQRNNRKLIPERIIVRNVDTGLEVAPTKYQATLKTDNLPPSKKKQMASSALSTPAPKQSPANEPGNRQPMLPGQFSDSAVSATNLSVLSLVLIDAPTRHDIGAILQCRATNIDAQKPIIHVIKLDVNLRPTKAVIVDMQRADQSLTAGSTVYVTCLTWGSRPAAKIRWFLRDKPLLDVKEVVFEGNSTTKSTVRLVLSALDNGAHLRCIAENPNAPLSTTANGLTSIWSSITPPGDDSTSTSTTADRHHQRHHQQQQQQQAVITTKMAAFDQITLLVKFLPNVTIEAVDADLHQQTNQRTKFPTTIYSVKEGDKLTLNCKIDSNPEPFKIRWLQNRKEIFPSVQKGITLQNHNRTLQVSSATRHQEGRYQCVVYNTLGRGDSKEIGIFILRAPRCALPPLTTIESSLQYPANLFCQVDANPMENVAIYWQTPTNILLSKDGKIIRVKSTNNAPAEDDQQKLQNSLDEFDPDNEYEVDEEGGNHGPSGGKRRLNRLLIASKGVRSRLTIVPQAITDFGIYRCWAENAIGSNQNEPCRFNLTSQATAGSLSPRPVHHCLTNYTADGYLSIRCLHSALNATASAIAKSSLLSAYSSLAEKHLQFHLEMHQISGLDGSLLALIANQTNPLEPIFLVQSLQPHAVYQINVYASNPYGVSDKVTMLFQTSNPTASNMTVSSSLVFSSSSSSSSSSTSSAKPTTSPIDDWLLGGAALPVGYDDESTHVSGNISEDEDVSGSELNFDLERSDDGTASGNDRWSISKPDLQKQNRLSDAAGGDVGASHRVLVILVTVLAASFIVFSILVAIAIGLCVYRNRRDKSRGNSGSQTSNSNQSNSESTSKPSTPKVAPSPNSSPVAKICTYSNHHHATLSTPDIIPCDGVLIFNPSSDISTSSANNFPSTVAAVAYGPNSAGTGGGAIYRDFVSLDSDSSYANYTASDASGCQQGQGAAGMTLHTLDPVSIAAEPAVEPKFLCQPNHVSILNDLNSTGFISGQGNVQLVTTGPTYSIEGASNGGQSFAASPFHLVNGPFLSIQPAAPNGQLGHQQHGRHNAAQFNQSQLLFMGKANQLVEDSHSSGQSQINSSFSLSESPSELTYHNSAHLSTFQQQQPTDGGGKTATATANGSASTTTTVTTTEDGEIIQATTV